MQRALSQKKDRALSYGARLRRLNNFPFPINERITSRYIKCDNVEQAIGTGGIWMSVCFERTLLLSVYRSLIADR